MAFIAGRLRGQLLEAGYRYDVVDAVLAEQAHNPYRALLSVQQLAGWVKRPDWSESVPTWTDWPSRLASSTKRRMSGILTSPSVFHIAYLFEKRVEEGERFELSRHSRALPGSGRVPYQLGEPSRIRLAEREGFEPSRRLLASAR